MSSETKEVESSGRKRPEGTMSFCVSAFPIHQWNEWVKDCKEKWGDCYWIKIWGDHVVAKDKKFLETILTEVEELKCRISSLESKKDDSNIVKTFTGEIKNG